MKNNSPSKASAYASIPVTCALIFIKSGLIDLIDRQWVSDGARWRTKHNYWSVTTSFRPHTRTPTPTSTTTQFGWMSVETCALKGKSNHTPTIDVLASYLRYYIIVQSCGSLGTVLRPLLEQLSVCMTDGNYIGYTEAQVEYSNEDVLVLCI